MSSPPSTPAASAAADIPPPAGPPSVPTVDAVAEPPVRKFPAPCWTQEETLTLIKVYQDKWYSLRRRNLRTADWEAVADEVNRRCPNQSLSPPKTSAQCRHKMEKLRKRYRTEKQRLLSLPMNHHNNGYNYNSRFFSSSSWVFFDLMDAMEVGSGSNNNLTNPQNGVFVKEEEENQKKPLVAKGKDELGKYFDEILMSMGKGKNQNQEFGGGIKLKVKNYHQQQYHHHHNMMQQQQQQEHQFDDSNHEDDDDDDDGYDGNGGGFDFKGGRRNSGFKRKLSGQNGERLDDSSSSKVFLNGCSSSKRRGLRGRDAVAGEMVASIKMLGEGLVRMEKMKMEMMREIERMRMEMEMKRSEMILESQHLIVNAFVEGLKKSKKVKAMEVE